MRLSVSSNRQVKSQKASKVDPLAQLVEHNTFNVGVLGSSPKRITKQQRKSLIFQRLLFLSYFFVPYFVREFYFSVEILWRFAEIKKLNEIMK